MTGVLTELVLFVCQSIHARGQDRLSSHQPLSQGDPTQSVPSDREAVDFFFHSLPRSTSEKLLIANPSSLDESNENSFDPSFLCTLIQAEAAPLSSEQTDRQLASTADLDFHKDYLRKRIEEMDFEYEPTLALFEEITVRGYRGSFKHLQAFLSTLGEKTSPLQTHLSFHKDYLIKRIEESHPRYPPATVLFEEIKTKGYRGSKRALQGFLTKVRKERLFHLPEAGLDFHKDYLINQIEDAYPHYPSAHVLFQEIQAKGYRGSKRTLQVFLMTMRKARFSLPTEAHLDFHKSYLRRRTEEMHPGARGRARILFEEIHARGYRGSIKSIRRFLSMVYKK